MKSLKIDVTKLRTVRNYAKMVGKTSDWIYKLIKKGDLDSMKIDGVNFVKMK